MINRLSYRACVLLVIVVLGAVIYANTFHAEFIFDDYGNIVEGSDIKNLFDLNTLWGKTQTRFIAYVTFALNYFWGGVDPFGYHLFNWVIHVLTSMAVFCLIETLFLTPRLKGLYDEKQSRLIALFASLIFLSHPLQTQAVTYIVQRIASLAALFYITAVFFYLLSRIRNNSLYYFGALFSTILAMLTKEICFTLPFIFLLIELCFFYEGHKHLREQLRNLMPFFVTLVIIPLLLFQGFEARTSIAGLTKETDVISRPQYLLTQINVLRTYLSLLFLPVQQSIDYDYPLTESLLDVPTVLSLMLLFSILAVAVLKFKKDKLISFGIFWFFITISVESSLIPINDVIQEHRVYLPMVGFCLCFSVLACRFLKNPRLFIGVATALILACSFLTYRRNEVWKTEIAVWQDALSKAPNKARILNSLGIAYLRKHKYDLARGCFMKSLAIKSNGKALTALGALNLMEEREDEAIEYFNKALELGPDEEIYNNLGVAYFHQQREREAEQAFREAIAIYSRGISSRKNLANLLKVEQRFQEALVLQKEILSLDPKDLDAMRNLIDLTLIVDQEQGLALANEYLQEIDNVTFLIDTAGKIALNKQGKMALAYYSKAFNRAPGNKTVLIEFGKFLANYRKYDKAIEMWERGLNLYPDTPEFQENIIKVKDIIRAQAND